MPQVQRKLQSRGFYLAFCLLCFGTALAVGLVATQSGAGVSPDSAEYIVTGDNISRGQGFTSFSNARYVDQPPMYPLLIAGFTKLGFDAEQAGRIVPILSFALLMFPLFFLGKRAGGTYVGYAGCLACLALAPLWFVSTYVWTEMPFILFSAMAVLCFTILAGEPDRRRFMLLVCASGFFTSLALLTRYMGATLVAVGAIAILLNSRSVEKPSPRLVWSVGTTMLGAGAILAVVASVFTPDFVASHFNSGDPLPEKYVGQVQSLRVLSACAGALTIAVGVASLRRYRWMDRLLRRVYPALLFGCIACLPLVPWLITHGRGHRESTVGLVANIDGTVQTIWNDFLGPLPSWGAYVIAAVMAAVLIGLIAYLRTSPDNRREFLRFLGANLAVIVFPLAFLATLILMRSWWHFDPINSRLASPAYPFIVVAVFAFIAFVYRRVGKLPLRRLAALTLVATFALFLAFQADDTERYLDKASQGQGYNSPYWRNAPGIAWLQSNLPDDAVPYSDRQDFVQFKLGRVAYAIPMSGYEERIDPFFEKLRGEENAFVIVFREPVRSWRLSHTELTELNEEYDVLQVAADFPNSTIWRVRAQK